MELWAFFKVIAHLAGASVSYGHISSSVIYIPLDKTVHILADHNDINLKLTHLNILVSPNDHHNFITF